MSILIKGINMEKMPECCCECPFANSKLEKMTRTFSLYIGETCMFFPKRICADPKMAREKDCPLIEIPPHGRLIDADAYLEKLMDTVNECVKKGVEIEAFRSFIEGAEVALVDAMTTLNNMPTIIEAEEVKE